MELDLLIRFLFSLLVGAFIGLEREYQHDEKPESKIHKVSSLGIRSFSLLSLAGGISVWTLSKMPFFAFGLIAGIIAIIVVSYIISSLRTKDHGITTEIGALLAFAVGGLMLVPDFPIPVSLALTTIVTFVLSRKQDIKRLAGQMHLFESNAFITYAILSLVILPFLPNQSIRLNDIGFVQIIQNAYKLDLAQFTNIELLNPHRLWLIVTLITGIDLLGYWLKKIVGSTKGWLLAALTGGFVSSTSTTQSLALRSKQGSNVFPFVSAAILANTASFLQMFILLAPLNPLLLTQSSLFIASLILSGTVLTAIFYKLSAKIMTKPSVNSKPEVFSIKGALKFAVIFSSIRVFTQVIQIILGEKGVLLASAVAATTGMDAITITLAEFAGNSISFPTAILSLGIGNAINLGSKTFYAYTLGARNFAKYFGLAVLVMILVSFIGLLISIS